MYTFTRPARRIQDLGPFRLLVTLPAKLSYLFLQIKYYIVQLIKKFGSDNSKSCHSVPSSWSSDSSQVGFTQFNCISQIISNGQGYVLGKYNNEPFAIFIIYIYNNLTNQSKSVQLLVGSISIKSQAGGEGTSKLMCE